MDDSVFTEDVVSKIPERLLVTLSFSQPKTLIL